MRARNIGLLALVLFAIAAPGKAAQLWIIEGLQPLNVFLSSDGTKVIGETKTANVYRPAYWTAQGGLQVVDSLFPDDYNQVRLRGISPDGSQLTGYLRSPTRGESAFLWSQGAGYQLLENDPDLDTVGNDVSSAGDVVGGLGSSNQGGSAFRWSAAGGIVELDTRVLQASDALAVSDNGKVIAGVDDGSGTDGQYMAVVWPESGERTQLVDDDRPKAYGEATAVSPNGAWVAGSHGVNSTPELFRWSPDKGVEFLGFGAGPSIISDDGRTIAGTAFASSSPNVAFIWTDDLGTRYVSDSLAKDHGVKLPANETLATVGGMSSDGLFVAGGLFGAKSGVYLAGLADEALPGDFNFDHRVDLADFGILKKGLGTGSFRNQGDANLDRVVDLSDFGILKEHFGKSAPAAVPEPSTLVLLTLGAFAVGRSRRSIWPHRTS